MSGHLAYTIPENGDALPTCGLQFADKFYILGADWRPFYLMPGPDNQQLVGYPAGIKPPTVAPVVTFNATNATNITFNSAFPTLYFSYSFLSRGRVVYSQMSPQASITLANPPKQVVVSGFEDPRDDATACAIDTIVIFCQAAINPGLMNTGSTMWIDCSDGVFSTKTFTFDISGATLDLGWNGSLADPYFTLPPAVKYGTVSGNRIWFGGTRGKVAYGTGITIDLQAGNTFRGLGCAVANIIGGTWNDSLYGMTLVVNGNVLGDVFDVGGTTNDNTVLYIDRDIPSDIIATEDFYFLGYNDRLFAGSFIDYTLGGVATSFTECINPLPGVTQILTPAIDGAKQIIGVQQSRGVVYALFPNCAQPILGGLEVNVPSPVQQENFGKTGPAADRSYCIDSNGQILFIGQEGLIALNTAQMVNIAAQVECLSLFKGGIWIALADLPSIVQAYARSFNGVVLGNFTIEGDANWWGLFSYEPQPGFWLFSNQEITTNIFEYTATDGSGVIVCGDGFNGRFKQLLDRTTYLDVQAASDTPAAYLVERRDGYVAKDTFQWFNKALIDFPGIIVPGETLTLAINQVWSNYPQRDLARVPAANKASRDVTINALQWQRAGLSPGQARYFSIGVSHLSNSGLSDDGLAPVRIPRYRIYTPDDGKAQP